MINFTGSLLLVTDRQKSQITKKIAKLENPTVII